MEVGNDRIIFKYSLNVNDIRTHNEDERQNNFHTEQNHRLRYQLCSKSKYSKNFLSFKIENDF